MIRWDERFLKKLNKLRIAIKLYSRYVDDTVIALEAIQKGWRYCSKKDLMIFDKRLSETDTRQGGKDK